MTARRSSPPGTGKGRPARILLLQGPNLNLLGRREPEIYGETGMEELHRRLKKEAKALGLELSAYQSNHEGDLIDAVQGAAGKGIRVLLVNAGGYTHTSVALRDALAACGLPYIEVHISNIQAREPFRRRSLIASGAAGLVAGFGTPGYSLALRGARDLIKEGEERKSG